MIGASRFLVQAKHTKIEPKLQIVGVPALIIGCRPKITFLMQLLPLH